MDIDFTARCIVNSEFTVTYFCLSINPKLTLYVYKYYFIIIIPIKFGANELSENTYLFFGANGYLSDA